MKTDYSFSGAVDAYLAQADYLTTEDMPLIVALKRAADELDANGVQAALLNTFGVTYRALAKRKAGDSGDVSEGEAFLQGL